MGTNKTVSTDNKLSLKVLRFSSHIPGYEKIKISARKMEISREKIDDARIWWGLQLSQFPSSYACDYNYNDHYKYNYNCNCNCNCTIIISINYKLRATSYKLQTINCNYNY